VYQTLVKCGDHVIPTYLSTRRSAFQASAASFFTCHMWADVCKGALAVILALFNFAKIEFVLSRPNVMVSVRWQTHAEPTLWLKGN